MTEWGQSSTEEGWMSLHRNSNVNNLTSYQEFKAQHLVIVFSHSKKKKKDSQAHYTIYTHIYADMHTSCLAGDTDGGTG